MAKRIEIDSNTANILRPEDVGNLFSGFGDENIEDRDLSEKQLIEKYGIKFWIYPGEGLVVTWKGFREGYVATPEDGFQPRE